MTASGTTDGARALLVGILVAALASACNGEGLTASKLSACGFYTEGEVVEHPLYAPDACYDGCLAEASCEELSAAICRESIELRVRCDERCAFHCPMGELIRREQECDGVENCEGGADEAECPEPDEACRFATRCDGVVACADLSDEQGCEPFVCDNGQRILGDVRCNGYRQCGDGSDEEECARLVLRCG